MTPMVDNHLDPDLNSQQPFRPFLNGQMLTFQTSDVIWSQKATLGQHIKPRVNILYIDPLLLMHTDVLVYRFAKVTIYLGFAFIVTIFNIFKLILYYQVDYQIWC